MCLRVNHYSKFSKVLNSERAFFLIVCFFFPGDSHPHTTLHPLMGDQCYLCQLLQLQPWLLSQLSDGHCSFCQHHLHCLVTCHSGGRPPAASFLYQVHTRALMVLCKSSGDAPNMPSLIMIYCFFIFFYFFVFIIDKRVQRKEKKYHGSGWSILFLVQYNIINYHYGFWWCFLSH